MRGFERTPSFWSYARLINESQYEERLVDLFFANEITDEAKKRSILLSGCGAKTYKLIRRLHGGNWGHSI